MASGIVESSSQDSSRDSSKKQEQQQQPGNARARVVQRLLESSNNLPAFINDLLNTMAVVVAGTEAAGFILQQQDGKVGLQPVAHIRPDDSDVEVRNAALKAFQEIVTPFVVQNKDGAVNVGQPDAGEPQFCIVTLLRDEGKAVAVAAVITRCRDHERARQRLMSMQLVAGYFEMFTLRRQSDQTRAIAASHQNVLQLATAASASTGFESAAMNLCNELANRTGATRVSLGWLKGNNIKVKALSHTEKFDKKQELILAIERVMEEVVDQEEPVRFDFDGVRSENVTRCAEALSRMAGNNSVYAVPMRRHAEIVGVLVLEFAPPRKLEDQLIDGIVIAAALVAPQLYDRYENDRWLAVKTGISIRENTKLIVGPKHMVAKLVVLLVLGAAAFVTVYRPVYHVSAPFTFVAADKRSITMPFDGEIAKDGVKVKPGDFVRAGDVLIQLNILPLRDKLNHARSDQAEAVGKAADAKAQKKIAESDIYTQQAAAAQADIDLYNHEIDQATLRAPFDGYVLRGDLEDMSNAHKQAGEVLLEFGHPNMLKGEATVSEGNIQDLKVITADQLKLAPEKRTLNGWSGTLATNSFPGESFPFAVTRIVPLGEPKEGDNVFKVYLELDKSADWMRPEMQGEARIDIGQRRLVWIWTHRAIDYLRLKFWTLS